MNKFYCKCHRCGKEVEIDPMNCITVDTMPPITKFVYKCNSCGHTGAASQDDVYGILKINKEEISEANIFFSVPCMICGQQVEVENSYQQYAVCDECKDAIKKLKSIISTNEKMGRKFDTNEEQNWSKAFELTKAQEEMEQRIMAHNSPEWSKPYWCDKACCCAECEKAIECARRYNMSEAIDLAAEKIYQDTKNMEIK